jgi:hypothetical protein
VLGSGIFLHITSQTAQFSEEKYIENKMRGLMNLSF